MYRSCGEDVFCKKGVLKDFAKFMEKQLCWCLVLIRLQGNFIKKQFYQKAELDAGVFL